MFPGVAYKLTIVRVNSLSSRPSQSEVMPIFFTKKRLFLGFFGLNKFSRPNGRLSPTACHNYLESLCINGQFKLSGNNFSASYRASEFCWQIGLNLLQHLRPCHIAVRVVKKRHDHLGTKVFTV